MAVRGLTMDVARSLQRNGLANLAGAMAFRVIRALVPFHRRPGRPARGPVAPDPLAVRRLRGS